MAAPVPQRTPPLSVEDYLELEEASPTKHEFVAGQLYALAGASARHNRIAGNMFGLLWNAARGGSCRVYGNDMRLRIGDDAVYYPDVQVVCDPNEEEDRYTTNPCIVVEVLSPSTQSIDLREKLVAYKRIKSLKAYLIVYRNEMRILKHFPDGDLWYDALYGGHNDLVKIPCLDVELSVVEIYDGVEGLAR